MKVSGKKLLSLLLALMLVVSLFSGVVTIGAAEEESGEAAGNPPEPSVYVKSDALTAEEEYLIVAGYEGQY